MAVAIQAGLDAAAPLRACLSTRSRLSARSLLATLLSRRSLPSSRGSPRQSLRPYATAPPPVASPPEASPPEASPLPISTTPVRNRGAEIKSAVPAGRLLTGLKLYKDQAAPTAMEDDQYPDWLWGVLAPTAGRGRAADKFRAATSGPMKKRVKARREPDADAAAAVRPAHALVPPHHQTADMPVAADTLGPAVTMGRGADSGADSGLDAGLDASLDASLDAGPEGALSPAAAARADQIRHMRHQRRAAIKESNFLKNMR